MGWVALVRKSAFKKWQELPQQPNIYTHTYIHIYDFYVKLEKPDSLRKLDASEIKMKDFHIETSFLQV